MAMVALKRKVVITCAVTGAIHTPSMSAHLPITADRIIESALGAAEAGAAILHLHARDQEDGKDEAREILSLKGADQVNF
jgi:uncharacterized protein (DUF849 family)